MAETIPFTEAKAHLSELVDRAQREHERFVVTKNGRPAAVILSPDELESLEETLEILSDPEMMEGIRESRRQIAEGKAEPLEKHHPRAL